MPVPPRWTVPALAVALLVALASWSPAVGAGFEQSNACDQRHPSLGTTRAGTTTHAAR